MIVIDTLALAERLEREYGDDPEKARRHARILGDMVATGDIATKEDVKDLRADLREVEQQLRADLREVEQQLRADLREAEQRLLAELHKEISAVRGELHKEIGAVRSEIGALSWKMAGLLVAQAAAIVALIKLLPGG